jgi:K+-sensing histidine kinase KdpD
VDVPPHGLLIDGDTARLTQVVSNLLTNAAKYTPPGGSIRLRGSLRALDTMRGARLVAVTGYGQASDRERALAAGFDHHLVKPVDLRALEQLLPREADA